MIFGKKWLSLKDLLSSTRTKQSLTKYLADALLTTFPRPLIVVQGNQARGKDCDVSKRVSTHSHEEADTLIPLHVLDTLFESSMKEVDVHCGDTDMILLLGYGGKCFGISNETWIKNYLSLDDEDPAIVAFQNLGTLDL